MHYYLSLRITLTGDASAYCIGAVISHVLPDGSERPIAFVSRTLSSSEKNYSQLKRKALSLVFGVKKFLVWQEVYTYRRPQAIVNYPGT